MKWEGYTRKLIYTHPKKDKLKLIRFWIIRRSQTAFHFLLNLNKIQIHKVYQIILLCNFIFFSAAKYSRQYTKCIWVIWQYWTQLHNTLINEPHHSKRQYSNEGKTYSNPLHQMHILSIKSIIQLMQSYEHTVKQEKNIFTIQIWKMFIS